MSATRWPSQLPDVLRTLARGEWAMLTGMTVASLAHWAGTPAPAFNATFYSTVATVIPVLFLAIAVQGRGYEDLLKAFTSAYRRWMTPGSWLRALPTAVILIGASMLAFVILVFGALGEVLAVYALYQQQAVSSTTLSVFLAVMFMVLMTAAGPVRAYGRAVFAPLVRDNKWIFSSHRDADAEPEATKAQEPSNPCSQARKPKTGTGTRG
jgi:hypothetical protein